VARLLAAHGCPQRLLVRNPAAAPDLPGIEVVGIPGYADGPACTEALQGVGTLFMVSARESDQRVEEHVTFVNAAAAAGVGHVIYTSLYRAAADAVFTFARDHWRTEEHIRASGLRWTFLRDCLYLDLIPMIGGPDGVIRGPAGNGRFSGVALDDVARVARAVLLSPEEHAGQTYDLTGPEELSMAEAAAIVTEVTGQPTRYVEETPEEAFASRASYGAPDWELQGWVTSYLAIAAGQQDGLSDDVERITGQRPVGLREMLSRS
jgi:NAD(P)H dehydrogenase (quinone)